MSILLTSTVVNCVN